MPNVVQIQNIIMEYVGNYKISISKWPFIHWQPQDMRY